jgi:hypothetical protein
MTHSVSSGYWLAADSQLYFSGAGPKSNACTVKEYSQALRLASFGALALYKPRDSGRSRAARFHANRYRQPTAPSISARVWSATRERRHGGLLCSKQARVKRSWEVREVSAAVERIDRLASEDKARLSRCETAARGVVQAFGSMLTSDKGKLVMRGLSVVHVRAAGLLVAQRNGDTGRCLARRRGAR